MNKFNLIKPIKYLCFLTLFLTLNLISQAQQFTVYHSWDFENEDLGSYTASEIAEDFNVATNYDHNSGSIAIDTINGVATKVLKITHEANATSVGFDLDARLSQDFDELYLSYNFKFDKEFNSTRGGKMPGLGGLPVVTSNYCPTSAQGFLCKNMHGYAGYTFSYHYDRTPGYGYPTYCPWGSSGYDLDTIYFSNGCWYNITRRVVMNTFTNGVANENGIHEYWVDGRLIFQETDLVLMEIESDTMKIDDLNIASFYGGNGYDSEPAYESYTYVDNITIYIPSDDSISGYDLHHPSTILPTPDEITDRDVYYDSKVTTEGTLSNSEYGSSYSICIDEAYLIDAGEGNTVEFNITAGTIGTDDYLFFYDGKTTDASIIDMIEGYESSITGNRQSTGRYMFVRFSSGKENVAAGWTGTVSFEGDTTTPAAPTSLHATDSTSSSISISWTDNSTNESKFIIERSFQSGSGFSVIDSVSANTTSYNDTGLSSDTTYYYKVKARNSNGDSGYSNTLTAHTVEELGYDTDLWMPDIIPLALGDTIELYTNDVAFIRLDEDRLSFQWQHNVGSSDSTQWNWAANQTGDFDLSLYCYYYGCLFDSVSTTVRVVNKVSTQQKNILAIGNSLTAGGYIYQYPQIVSDLDFTLNAIGTQGSTIMHEGHSGWQFETFLSSSSPFYINSTIDFGAYINNNSLANPDIIKISLGINDCYLSSTLDYIMDQAEQLIDTIHQDYPESIITIALPTTCEGTGDGWLAAYGSLVKYEPYQLRMRELWKRIYNTYGNNQYSENVFVSYDGLCIDRINGYPSTEGVHPNASGYRQLARGVSNTINYAFSEEDTLAPAAPTNLVVTDSTSNSISISWTDNSSNESKFIIERSLSSGSGFAIIDSVGTNVNSYTNTGLSSSTTYYYKVKAKNSNGESSYSNEESGTTLSPDSVTNVSQGKTATQSSTEYDGYASLAVDGNTNGTFSNGSVTHTESDANAWWQVYLGQVYSISSIEVWNRTDYCCMDRLDDYYVFVADTFLSYNLTTTINQSGIWYEHRTSYPDSTHYFSPSVSGRYVRVQLGNTDNLSLAEVIVWGSDTVVNTAPNPPSGLNATDSTATTISLSWTDNADNEDKFIIERSLSSGSGFAVIDSVNANVTSYTNTGLSSSTTYYYKVKARNSYGDSGYSNEEYATTLGTAPAAPSSLSATDSTSSTITIGWTDNSNNEDKFIIERSLSSGSGFAVIDSVNANVTSYTNTGLTAETTYYYKVKARNSYGDSGYSNEESATTLGSSSVRNVAINKTATQISTSYGATADRAVDNNTDGNWDNGSVATTQNGDYPWWQVDLDSTFNIQSIEIWNRTGCCWTYLSNFYVFVSEDAFTSTDIATTIAQSGVNTYFVTNYPDPDTSFSVGETGKYIRVQRNTTNTYMNLAEVKVWGSYGGGSAPAAPSGLETTDSTATSITIGWTDNASNEDKFIIERSFLSGSGFAVIDSVNANVTSYTNTGLITDTTYYYKVKAKNSYGESSYSNTLEAHTADVTSTNVSQGKTATQSSTDYDGYASLAVDGDTNGSWSNGSVTHTDNDANAWWQVDLGDDYQVTSIEVWNRTDVCCMDRLDNYYVMLADTFTSYDLSTTLAQEGVWSEHKTTYPDSTHYFYPDTTGHYVRVQLGDTNNLSLAEVVVWGYDADLKKAILSEEVNPGIEPEKPINVYPNPGSTMITISGFEQAVEIKMVDMLGKVVYLEGKVNNSTQIDVSNLKKGLYLILVKKENNIHLTKFIKN